ncbi:hypothetical protein BCR34DRAFT_666269 [Clohesyomyces aquaticus]|uniref:DUF924-domain-containing protein n=1 Tax=Clohesyomyces aquaticus TaxID=1231657 RepID=A0A1Y1ZCV7_9PLEO|nr:hypothetical protein BCR34DRAFT_666269 [Clohesyomyces aquaticus]
MQNCLVLFQCQGSHLKPPTTIHNQQQHIRMFIRHPLFRLLNIQTLSSAIRLISIQPASPIMDPEVKRVIAFWFNRPPLEWIIAPEGLDAQLKSEFGDLVLKARRNELDNWATSPEGSVAIVTLLDQFTRNLFRGTAEAFSGDAKAFEVATKAVAQDFDKQVTVIQASAFYMCLMQQESLVSVIAARGLFEKLKERCESEEEHKWVGMGVPAAGRHLQQLLRFGRYPTRNALLGRKNTEDEEMFLREHVSSL